MPTLHLIVDVSVDPNDLEEAKSIFMGLLAPTRREPGCIRYELYQSTEDPSRLALVEAWEHDQQFDTHFASDHVQAAFKRLAPLLIGELKLTHLHEVE